MSSLFNRQIFVDKLAKLNSSQQSIETLSHWCIFHRNNAKEFVETWDSEFHCSPLDKHVPFLYLANDILQNSRRKGSEFVNEYWKVLPNALNYVLENGNEDGRKAALRLIDIWEERKVFGSRGQVLKEEVLGRNLDKNYRNGKPSITKLKLGNGDVLKKLISSYEQVGDASVLEDALFAKYHNSISYLERVEKEIASDPDFGRLNRSGRLEEMQAHLDTIEECMNKLAASKLSRTTLISHLREAILEQEVKIEQVHHHVQASESKAERLNIISDKLRDCKICQAPEQNVKEAPASLNVSANLIPDVPASTGGQGIPSCAQQMATIDITSQTDEQRKSAAAAMAAKLTAATDSADLLRMVFSSLASESHGKFANEDVSSENKKLRIDSGPVTPYVPEPVSSSYADTLHHQPLPLQRPLQLQPPLRPLPVPEFIQNSGASVTNVPYNFASTMLQNPTMMTNYQMTMFSPAAPNPFGLAANFPASDGSGGSLSQPAESAATSPIPH